MENQPGSIKTNVSNINMFKLPVSEFDNIMREAHKSSMEWNIKWNEGCCIPTADALKLRICQYSLGFNKTEQFEILANLSKDVLDEESVKMTLYDHNNEVIILSKSTIQILLDIAYIVLVNMFQSIHAKHVYYILNICSL
jgi:hypothetical protein